MKQVFRKYALDIFNNGYSVIPITPIDADVPQAGKVPAMKGWARMEIGLVQVTEWQKRFARYGVGIRTAFTPAVDIDCLEREASAHMREFVETMIGPAPARVGRDPKVLLVYRADEPFTKVKSHTWIDEWGEANAVEILGVGQQFVAWGLHPGTRKPYEWVTEETPLNSPVASSLEIISLELARVIVDEFDRYARAQGWECHPKRSASRGVLASGGDVPDPTIDNDDWVDADDARDKWQGSHAELQEIMRTVPPAEEYDDWYPVLAALKDAEREPDEFRDIALEWSARASNFDEDAFDQKWEKGGFNRTGRATFSINALMKRAEIVRMETDITEEIVPLFVRALTLQEWDKAAERLRETPVFGTLREHAVDLACDHYKRITGKKIPTITRRMALSVDYTQFEPPEWVVPWAFVQSQNMFVHRQNGIRLVPHAFNNTCARHTKMMNMTPEIFVTQMCPIPVIDGTMYNPSAHGLMPDSDWRPSTRAEGEEFFDFNGMTYLNTFRPASIPTTPEKMTRAGRKAAEVVLHYFRTQFPDPLEFTRVMDWLAWVINNPTKRINYALLILGGQGSGKSIIKKFMKFMLGAENVGTVSNQIIHKSFSGWQAGSILKVIEEISVAGHRYDVMNALKEPITNETLYIERKHQEGVEEVNTASWMAYTNDIAALPVTMNDRRWLIVRSQFTTKQEVEAYSVLHPEFFRNFEAAFTLEAGQIRLFFARWQYAEDFDPTGHAPVTDAQEAMMHTAYDGFSDAVLNCVDSGDCSGITPELIHAYGITVHIPRETVPSLRHVASRLAELGYQRLGPGRIQVRVNNKLGSIYARDPKKWQLKNGRYDLQAIVEHFDTHTSLIPVVDEIDVWR